MKQPGYQVTCGGQYYAGTGRDKLVKTFKSEVFYIPQVVEIAIGRKYVEKAGPNGTKTRISVPDRKTVNGLKAAQHIIQRRLLAARLTEKYVDFTGVRTCQILDSKQVAEIPAEHIVDTTRPVKNMNLVELKTICAMESLNVNPAMFADLDDARSAVEQELKTVKRERPTETAPTGVLVSAGAVTADDGVPTDEEDPAAGLM
jgi:hypothetical protein